MELKSEREGSLVDAALEEGAIDGGAHMEVEGVHLGEGVHGFAYSAVFAEGGEVGE